MRVVSIIFCASLSSACFTTEPLTLGALDDAVPDSHDGGLGQDASSPQEPELDASSAGTQDADLIKVTDASHPSARPDDDDDDDDDDASEREEVHPSDAALEAGYDYDAGANNDAGMVDSGTIDAGAVDAGSDAARSLLCTLEPWHCP